MNDLTIDPKLRRLDLAARAAWLYYIKRRTQDEIAVELNVSRPNAQRLVALALSEGLVHIRIDHPLAKSIELGERVRERFDLTYCDVAPSESRGDNHLGVAHRAAELLESFLSPKTPQVLAFGTGRTLREAVRLVSTMSRPDHKIVSAVGNLSRVGRASPYDVVMRLSDRVGAQCYPLPLPVIVDSEEECSILKAQPGYRTLQTLFQQADALMVGVGRLDEQAPLLIDGFITQAEFEEMRRNGAKGELTSRSFDGAGRLLDGGLARRLTAMELTPNPKRPTILVASGHEKAPALHAALAGRLGNGVIIDEDLAQALLCIAQ